MGLMDGKVVVITGAGRGIGRSHALRFCEEGATVVVNDVGLEIESGADGSGRSEPTNRRDASVANAVVDEIRARGGAAIASGRSEEHTSELQSPCISYAVFCLKKKNERRDLGRT